ncbi:MAG TPA: aminoglycoside phosphotransferase family protein [Thermoanaerobaculia bacterium]|nr:aminoglycoside phosphotransferase family protein [Thermoanaerobaculia bacterium]
MQIPKAWRETVERVHGETGRQWLATLPSLVSECRARWSLELDPPFENLSFNLVFPGRTSGGTEIVLKIGVPCRELLTEASALSLFQGAGAARLLNHDAARGILLMERVEPGTPLHKLQGDPEATSTAAALMRRLWRTPPADHSFPSLAVWFRAFDRLRNRFDGGSGPFPSDLLAQAESTLAELNASSEGHVILHGDLHHDNILFSTRRGWVAIDPKGVVGDPGYEVGPFLLNRLPPGASDPVTSAILTHRLARFSDELQIQRERLAGWAFCHAVLSALWDFEDSVEWHSALRLARVLDPREQA